MLNSVSLFKSVLVAAGATALLGTVLHSATQVTKNAKAPVVRISKGRFAPERYEEVKRLIDQSATPLDPNTQFGPLASEDQYQKVSGYVEVDKEEGANLYLGGGRFSPDGQNGKGYYWEPTVFTGVEPEMHIFQEEIFGPVLAVTAFDTEEEAIELTNGTDFGLASGVQTRDIKRAHRVAAAMQAGTVWVNTYNMYDTTTPFGGYKASGFGRECGPEVMENYTQTKSVWIDLL